MTAVAIAPITPRRSWRQRTQSTRTAYLFLLPALLVMAIITFYPLVFQIWMAFTDFQLKNLRPNSAGPAIVGLQNFTRILDSNIVIPNFDFARVLVFNLFWAFTNVVIHVVIGVTIALVLNVDGLRFKRVWRAIYILPIAIPPIIVATGALQSIPKDLYEAAEMDGAGYWDRLKTVTLPFLRPAMLPFAIYGFVLTFKLFTLSYFMSGGGPFGQTELLVTIGYRLVQEQSLYGVAAAFAIFQFFILLVITLITNRLARATASYDA